MLIHRYRFWLIILTVVLTIFLINLLTGQLPTSISEYQSSPLGLEILSTTNRWIISALAILTLLVNLVDLPPHLNLDETRSVVELDTAYRQRLIKTEREKVEKRLQDTLKQTGLTDLWREDPSEESARRSPSHSSFALSTSDSTIQRGLEVSRDLLIQGQKVKTLEPREPLAEVLQQEEIDGRLLILGEPGSGKTTALLGLAKDLLQAAEQDLQKPLPLLFELSSFPESLLPELSSLTWQEASTEENSVRFKADPLLNWLVAELKDLYNLQPAISKSLIETGKILLLLDGLDELEPTQQSSWVKMLSHYLKQDDTRKLVLCCRWEEYEQSEVELSQVNGAIYLQPLTDEQIQTYLIQRGKIHFWQTIQHEPELNQLLQPQVDGKSALLRLPLFLSIAAIACNGQVIRNQTELWDAYIENQLSHPLQASPHQVYKPHQVPSRRQTRYYLSFLAKHLQKTQTEFLIEQTQPTWLWTTTQRWGYTLIGWLVLALFLGLIFWLVSCLLTRAVVEVVPYLILGLIFGLLGWLIGATDNNMTMSQSLAMDKLRHIKPAEAFQLPMKRPTLREIVKHLFHKLFYSLIVGLLLGIFVGLLIALDVGLDVGIANGLVKGLWLGLASGMPLGIVSGLVLGVVFGLADWLVSGLNELQTQFRIQSTPNQGTWAALKNTPVAIALLLGSLTLVLDKLPTISLLAILWGFTYVISHLGVFAGIQHVALRIVLFCSFQKRGNTETRCIPWNYARFLTYAVDRRLIQQFGGRYRFIHHTLMEHFANMI